MRIVYLTAGAAGMYCGSCLHDNAIAKAMIKLGHDALLVPIYTPILTDETNISQPTLFYGGLNVYMQQMSSLFRWLPRWADGWLSSPRLVRWIAGRAMGTSAENLGALTVSMLRGIEGRQGKEVHRLCDWLQVHSPELLVFSNLLIAGCIDELKRRMNRPVVVVLQGDDIFCDSLPEPYRGQALVELRRLAKQVDMFIVHSRDYGLRMQQMLQFDEDRLQVSPLSIDTADFSSAPWGPPSEPRAPTIGYLARLAPEKGLHLLVDAFIEIHRSGLHGDTRLAIAGWLGKQHEEYWAKQQEKLTSAGLDSQVTYHGSVDRPGKLHFLRSIDVLSVPTPYLEPKGLFVLEALAAGVPYVQPAHGAFPELYERLGGGHLFDPNDTAAYAARLRHVLDDLSAAQALGRDGQQRLLSTSASEHEAQHLLQLFSNLLHSN
ncbi:MAG: glycosyltransferase family 4 protein [Planctomycetales bacterium]|nr:glycosyltransferase family 4 protein [Planctomycetales bacterium]